MRFQIVTLKFFLVLFPLSASFRPTRLIAADDLPRRASMGTHIQPVSAETQKRLGLKSNRGVEVVDIVPDSTAAAAGITKGDVLLSVDNKSIASVPEFVQLASTLRSGTNIEIRLNRDGTQQTIAASPKELPRESSDELVIEYGAVESRTGKLRTVVTMPKHGQSCTAFLLLSGLGNGPAEHPVTDALGLKLVAYELTRAGFVVMRVDKPGCGDSEGGPAADVTFDAVVDGYVAGLKQLKKHPGIDPARVYLLGVSMGGVQAPLVAAQESVAGIAIFGAMSCSWNDFIANSTRHQMTLSGVAPADIDKAVALETAGWHALMDEQLSPDKIFVEHPELADWSESTWADGKYFSGISYQFFQQLGQHDVRSAWQRFDGKVLTMWGASDFVTFADDHLAVAELVNQQHVGNAQFRQLPNIDHNMRIAETVEQSMKTPGKPSTAVIETVIEWVKGI